MMNHYKRKAELISWKYAEFMPDFEKQGDDRRIAFNCYQQIIGACKVMAEINTDNNFICCAINHEIASQEEKIDSIITRFTGKVYKHACWKTPEEHEGSDPQ